jgi:hypothetical protein
MNLDEMKRQAYILVDYLRQEYQDTTFYVGDCLDVVSKMNGYEDWNQAVQIMEPQ